MFKLLVLVFAVIFAVAMAAPEAKPQYFYSGYPYAATYGAAVYPSAVGYGVYV